MKYKTDNAIIMAAGTSCRFAPLSYETPKPLLNVRGEVLIERQIKQLKDAGIGDIIIVVGYMKERLFYLKDKFNVRIVENDDYNIRNNNSSIYAVREYLGNSYVCSADNYFTENPFESEVSEPYYSALYAEGKTDEWCVKTDADGYINKVTIGGEDSLYMMGHVFWDRKFSEKFTEILLSEYNLPETAGLLWEAIYANHLDDLKLKVRRYENSIIAEIDSLDELRAFDKSYINDTRSKILKQISNELGCKESELYNISAIKDPLFTGAVGFDFSYDGVLYRYNYTDKKWWKLNG